jgi:hypothetical protein
MKMTVMSTARIRQRTESETMPASGCSEMLCAGGKFFLQTNGSDKTVSSEQYRVEPWMRSFDIVKTAHSRAGPSPDMTQSAILIHFGSRLSFALA